MAYNIYKSDGTQLVALDDYLIDNTTLSINLIGKNVSGYGTQQNENFLYLLENFANSVPPASPLAGQLWFDKSSDRLRPMAYDGGTWRPLGVTLVSSTSSDTAMVSGATISANSEGDFWYNTDKGQLFINTGTGFSLIGPEATPGFAKTRMSSEVVLDNGLREQPVVKMVVNDETIAILSGETFLPGPALSAEGFGQIYRGITLKNYSNVTRYSTTTTDVLFHGMVEQLDETYPRRDQDEHITGNWIFDDFKLLQFGSAGNSAIKFQSFGGGFPPTLELSHGAGTITFASYNGSLIYNGEALTPNAPIVQDIGSSAFRFNNVYTKTLNSGGPLIGSSISGLWNLAEDAQLNPGSDNGNDLGKASLRFKDIYTFGINSGADQGFIKGNWALDSAIEFLPRVDSTNDLGASARKFKTVYTNGIATDDPYTTLNVVGELTLDGSMLPTTGNQYNIGSPSKAYNTIYSNNVTTDRADIGAINGTVQNLLDSYGNSIIRFDRDAQLSSNSDTRLPTQKSVKAYVDSVRNGIISQIAALQQTLQNQINDLDIVPIGTVFYTASSNCPAGFLECDGSSLLVATYQRLFNVIAYTYGGSGATFRLPDLRGEFIRGYDHGRGIDPSRAFGSSQTDQSRLEQHYHIMPGDDQLGFAGNTANWPNKSIAGFGYDARSVSGGGGQMWLTTDAVNVDGATISGQPETRSRNVALLPIIKY
jgi:microcystin-dependent protein